MSPFDFLIALMQLDAHHPFSETGGKRTPAHNDALDGVAHSPHLYWVGRDVIFDTIPHPLDLEEIGRRLGLKIINERDHYHVQPADWIPG